MRTFICRFLLLIVIALAMTYLFWWPLYEGAGFIGGDLYPYFFPQKAFYAQCLKSGTLPLWNDLAGFGYPILGESQTGAAYPFHVVFYRCFDLNTAYNIEHLLHYVICFVGTWLFAKRLGLTTCGAALAAVVFTYGWFPPRACLEWAILTGAWMPVALWCVESFLQTRWWRYAIGLSFTLGIQLLAGHFHLAFITEMLVVTYAARRLWTNAALPLNQASEIVALPSSKRAAIALALSVVAGGLLASIQLLPTWELKQRSSRVVEGGDYDPAYGHMPPLYVTQAIAPWIWYSPLAIGEENLVRDIAEFAAPWHWFGPLYAADQPDQPYDIDRAIQRSKFAALSTGTNKVEAHFYCGLIPVGMAIYAMIQWLRNRRFQQGQTLSVIETTTDYWLIAGFLAIVYATGLLLPIGRHLPGFSFFRGPGRYGIVTTMSIALLAGQTLSRLVPLVTSRSLRILVLAVAFGSTCGDLWLVSRMVRYTVTVSPPRISLVDSSEVRRRLLAEPGLPRLLSPGPNVGTLLGVSCVPWYLGIAPAEYLDPRNAMPAIPKPHANKTPTQCTPELLEWLSRSGVTHVLNFELLDEPSWHVERIWSGFDAFLNRVWAREEPIHLYRFRHDPQTGELAQFPGRAYLVEGHGHVSPENTNHRSTDSRHVIVESEVHEKSKLVLTELAFPGWIAHRNSIPVDATNEGLFRAIELPDGDGEIQWTYQPRSFYLGAAISLATLIVLASIGHMKFWHPKLVDRVLG